MKYIPPKTEHLVIELEQEFCGHKCSVCDEEGNHKGHHKSGVEDFEEVELEIIFE